MSQLTTKANFLSRLKLSSAPLVLGAAFLLLASVVSCAPIRNTPFGEKVDTSFTNLNGNSHSLLPGLTSSEKQNIKFSLFTDAHANYDDLSRVVQTIRNSDSLLAINLGDMTDLGLALEYEAFASHVENINKPLFSVIGNHDTIGNGKAIFQKLFGAYNYYFDLNGVRFIFFNNNALDFFVEGINLDWLEQTVQDSFGPVMIFQHVNPLNSEYFTPNQQAKIKKILNPEKVLAVFHGHHHSFQTYEINGVLIQQVARVEGNQYSEVQVTSNLLTITNCSQGGRCEKIHRSFGDILE